MNEHLFKIKKDGKTAGYCEWTEDWGWKYFNDFAPENKFTYFTVAQTGLTAHPFVTKDKNGKDVFEDDEIKGINPCLIKDHPVKGIVFYDKIELCWFIETESESITLSNIDDIELIKDEEDD